MKRKPRSIAITGGRGRLGRVMAHFFRQQGDIVQLFSRNPSEEFLSLEELLDPEVMSSYDFLLHAAWSSTPSTSEQRPAEEERADFPLLERLLASWEYLACSTASLHKKNLSAKSKRQDSGLGEPSLLPRLLFFSSAAVYGNTRESPASEEQICCPLSGYARGKWEAEQLILHAMERHHELQASLLRISNVLGINKDLPSPQGHIPDLFTALQDPHLGFDPSGEKASAITIGGSGDEIQDYLWIDDFLRALDAVFKNFSSGIVNLGSGRSYSLNQLIRWIEAATQKRLARHYIPAPEWEAIHSQIDISTFRAQFDWSAQVDIPKALADLVQVYHA